MDKPKSRAARTIIALEKRADHPWFLPAASVFPLTDYVLPFLPNQMLLVGLAMSLPKRWIALVVSFVIATGLGAGLTALAIQVWGTPLVEQLFGGLPEEGAAGRILDAVRDWGLLALAAIAMLPWPPRTAVIVCAIAGLSPLLMALAVAAGRIVPAALYAGIGAKAPQLLRRFDRIDQVMTQVEEFRKHARTAKAQHC